MPVRADAALGTSGATALALLLVEVSWSFAEDRIGMRVELEEEEPDVPAPGSAANGTSLAGLIGGVHAERCTSMFLVEQNVMQGI